MNHNNEADQNLNTFINMWCTYIYTHIYSVHSMMVRVLPTCVLLSWGWGVKEGFPPCFWVTHVFVWHLLSVLFPSLPASLPPPHLLFITTIPPLLTRQRSAYWFFLRRPINQPCSDADGFLGRATESPTRSTALILAKSLIGLSVKNPICRRVHACFNLQDPILWELKCRASVFAYTTPQVSTVYM